MDHSANARKGALQPPRITHISNEVAKAGMIQAGRPHVVLLEFITAEYDQALWPVFFQHDLDKFFTERSGPAGHQN